MSRQIRFPPIALGFKLRQALLGAVCIVAIVVLLTQIPSLEPAEPRPIGEEQREDESWIATSSSWPDRMACKWIGVCGVAHVRPDNVCMSREHDGEAAKIAIQKMNAFSWDAGVAVENRTSEENRLRFIPQYVLDHAPLVHLYSQERFWPSDIQDHLRHTTPHVNYTLLAAPPDVSSTRKGLDSLDEYENGRAVFLQSDDDVEYCPAWLASATNVPGTSIIRTNARKTSTNSGYGKSKAPAICIVIDKGEGVIDAFWFYFYSYNLGNSVLGMRFGNHVGDWEHSLVRFRHEKPQSVFLSEHSGGKAYMYGAVEKLGKRPVIYSAVGSHAMYATPGSHPYGLPFGLLSDTTDRGPLWDPAANAQVYTYTPAHDALRASTLTANAATEWFYFRGHWGDKFYRLNDTRQYRFFGEYHYVNGPLGPRFKDLDRVAVCPDARRCKILDAIA